MNHSQFLQMMALDVTKQDDLTSYVANLLEDSITRYDAEKKKTLAAFTGLQSAMAPPALVWRIQKYSGASTCCLLLGLIYLERLKKHYASVHITSRSFVRLFLTSTMTAAKYFDDFHLNNKMWAEIGGISVAELKRLELEFLFLLNFRLHIDREEYDWYQNELRNHKRFTIPKVETDHSLFAFCNTAIIHHLKSILLISPSSPGSRSRSHSPPASDDKASTSFGAGDSLVIYDIPRQSASLDQLSLQRYIELYIA